ncbi:MAG: FAD-dependent oxidoreductase [Christensenellales bacterium]|jgi:hypothetical protein
MKEILLTAGRFDAGKWTFDTQFLPNMGMPYLLAHGLGLPVGEARAEFTLPPGGYLLWVYTYNWVAPWKPEYAPGRFALTLDGEEIGIFGDAPATWGWVPGGRVELKGETHRLTLRDLTGFAGRCGGVFLTQREGFTPPPGAAAAAFWKQQTQTGEPEALSCDFAVCGGGIAGICAAVMAARQGLDTVLVQDRPVVGGNNSSEVRVWLGGDRNAEPFPGIGNIVGELEQERTGHYGAENRGEIYEDDRKLALLREAGVRVLLHTAVTGVTKEGSRITSLTLRNLKKDTLQTLVAPVFADCTGDGTVGALAGAEGETTTNGHMGMTNCWYIEDTGTPQSFPACPWAMDLKGVEFPGRGQVRDIYGGQRERSFGCWFWESGMERDPIAEAELARDTNFRAMYGAWDAVKNTDGDYGSWRLGESCAIGGKRESRRLFGDVILTKAEVYAGRVYEDGCVPSFWNFDVHYPDPRFYAAFHEGDGFLTHDYHEQFPKPFWVPYRCLYSRNVDNLFLAGRDVSVSHDALGTVRVMRTGGMMGEVIGMAARFCKERAAVPREVYTRHLQPFMAALKAIPHNGIPRPEKNRG